MIEDGSGGQVTIAGGLSPNDNETVTFTDGSTKNLAEVLAALPRTAPQLDVSQMESQYLAGSKADVLQNLKAGGYVQQADGSWLTPAAVSGGQVATDTVTTQTVYATVTSTGQTYTYHFQSESWNLGYYYYNGSYHYGGLGVADNRVSLDEGVITASNAVVDARDTSGSTDGASVGIAVQWTVGSGTLSTNHSQTTANGYVYQDGSVNVQYQAGASAATLVIITDAASHAATATPTSSTLYADPGSAGGAAYAGILSASYTHYTRTDNLQEINIASGNHTVYGGAVVNAGDGNNVIQQTGFVYTGTGNDTISGADIVVGGTGNNDVTGFNTMYAGSGSSNVGSGTLFVGGSGYDTIDTVSTVYTGSGNDSVSNAEFVYEGSGNDTISDSQNVYAGSGNDLITDSLNVYAGSGNDTIVGGQDGINVTIDPNTVGQALISARSSLSDPSEANTLKFGSGVSASNLHFFWSQDNGTPTLDIDWGTDQRVRLLDQAHGFGFKELDFADGTALSLSDVLSKFPQSAFVFQAGMGDRTLPANITQIRFSTGISSSDLIGIRDGSDLLIEDGGDDIRIPNWYSDSNLRNSLSMTFADGTFWNSTAIGNFANTFFFYVGMGSQTFDASMHGIHFASGINTGDITVSRNGLDLLISDGADQVRIPNWYANGPATPNLAATFHDGTTWSASTLTTKGLVVTDTQGHQTLTALSGFSNTLIGGPSDTFILNQGDTSDVIVPTGTDNTLVLGAGSTPINTWFVQQGSDVRINGTGSSILLKGVLAPSAGGLAEIDYADGSKAKWVAGTPDYGVLQIFDASGKAIGDAWWADGYYGFHIVTTPDGGQTTSLNNTGTYATATNVTNDYAGNVTIKSVDASGNVLNDFWTHSDGSWGVDTFNSDGSSDGKSYSADGSYTAYSNDGQGVVVTSVYDAQGNLLSTRAPFVFRAGMGDQTLSADATSIRVSAGLIPSALAVSRDANDLLLSDGADTLRIPGWYADPSSPPNVPVIFSDGTTWDTSLLSAKAEAINFEIGMGQVTLPSTVTSVQFPAGVSASDVSVSRDGVDLLISKGDDSYRISNWYGDPSNLPVLFVEFNDGTSWDSTTLTNKGLVVNDSTGNRTLTGLVGFDNVLIGGPGDTFVVNAGDGVDQIEVNGGNNVLKLDSVLTRTENYPVLSGSAR